MAIEPKGASAMIARFRFTFEPSKGRIKRPFSFAGA
jgi:hypothetical protein